MPGPRPPCWPVLIPPHSVEHTDWMVRVLDPLQSCHQWGILLLPLGCGSTENLVLGILPGTQQPWPHIGASMAEGGGTNCGTGAGRDGRLTLRLVLLVSCGHHPHGPHVAVWLRTDPRSGCSAGPWLPAMLSTVGMAVSVQREIHCWGQEKGKFLLNASSLLGGVVQGNESMNRTEIYLPISQSRCFLRAKL